MRMSKTHSVVGSCLNDIAISFVLFEQEKEDQRSTNMNPYG